MTPPLLVARGVDKTFTTRSLGGRHRSVHAVRDASFEMYRGETLGVVGESGSGKSTLARLVGRLIPADRGSVTLDGVDVFSLSKRDLRQLRREIQFVFQDPFSSLDPSWTVFDIIGEPLRLHDRRLDRVHRRERVIELMRSVELSPDHVDRYPHEFSGGQRQRIAIARAIALSPSVVICDEAVSALDVSTQAAVLNLLSDLQEERNLTYLFISHDLSVVRHLCDRVVVMYRGTIVESGTAKRVFDHPVHPYTQLLRNSVPIVAADPPERRVHERTELRDQPEGQLGCPFYSRCPQAHDHCATDAPTLTERTDGSVVACHLVP